MNKRKERIIVFSHQDILFCGGKEMTRVFIVQIAPSSMGGHGGRMEGPHVTDDVTGARAENSRLLVD